MGKYKELKEDQNEAFNRLRSLEDFKASHSTQMGNLEDLMKRFLEKFEQHDEKEMKKYDVYDEHVQKLNITLREVQADVKEIKSKGHDHEDAMEKCKDNFEAYKKEVSEELKELWARVNKWLGAIAITGTLGAVGYTYWMHTDSKEKVLMDKIEKLQRENAMNYGRQQMIMREKDK